MDHAIVCKDKIWKLLSDAPDRHTYLQTATAVMTALDLTEGLWRELGYSYKAAEIAQSIVLKCDHFLTCCLHYKQIGTIAQVRDAAHALQRRFNNEQAEAWKENQPPLATFLNPNDAEDG